MRKLLALIALFLMIGLTAAFPTDLNVVDREANITDPARFDVKVQNSFDQEKRFRLTIDGFKESWWFYDGNTEILEPGEETVFNVTVNATPKTVQKDYNFTIKVKTLENEEEQLPTYFTVERTRDLRIESFETSQDQYKEGESIETHTKIENTDSRQIDDYSLVIKIGDNNQSIETENLDTGITTLTSTVKVPSKESGTIEAILRHEDYEDTADAEVEVVALEKEEKQEKDDDKTTRQTAVLHDLLTRSESVSGYEVYYWMPVTLMAFLVGGLILVRKKITRKKITKVGKEKEDGKVKILLEISNKTGEPMENIEVHDFIPEMLEIGEEFETLEPELEQTDHGTKLKWDIDRMEPKESRVLTYQIKSDMDVESEIILREAEIWEDGKKVNKSTRVKANFPAKDST